MWDEELRSEADRLKYKLSEGREQEMVEKIVFVFKHPPKELTVRKVKIDRANDAYGSWYGKIRWRVEKIEVPGCPVKEGAIVPTSRVYQIARTIDKKAAHQFELYNPKPIYDPLEED